MQDITREDFVSALICGIVARGEPIEGWHFLGKCGYAAAHAAFERLRQEEGLDLRFLIILDRTYSDSPVWCEAVAWAAGGNLICRSEPGERDFRIIVGSEAAQMILANLPGDPKVWERVVEVYVNTHHKVFAGASA